MGLQDSHQQARCWFGAGIAQQLQAEQDAALQSLDTAHALCTQNMQQGALKQQQPSALDKQNSQKQHEMAGQDATMQQQTAAEERSGGLQTRPNAAESLAVKCLLAKASLLKQLHRSEEANDCMTAAKQLNPAVAEHIKL